MHELYKIWTRTRQSLLTTIPRPIADTFDYPARVPRRRRSRIAGALLCAALVLMLAFLGTGAVGSARSVKVERSPVAAFEPVWKPPTVRPVAKPKPPVPYRIAFFGDSVSVGFGASDRRRGYVARVSDWLRANGKRVIQTVDAKGGVPVAFWAYTQMPTRLDAAVVELGTNDVRLGTPSTRFAQEYRTLTSRIRSAAPKVRLLCLSVWSHPGGASLDRVINAQIRAVCPGTYVDITRLRNLPDIRSSDRFHPNDAGYRLIAQAVVAKLDAK